MTNNYEFYKILDEMNHDMNHYYDIADGTNDRDAMHMADMLKYYLKRFILAMGEVSSE